MSIDHAKMRRESIRWMVLLALNNGRPIPTSEHIVLTALQAVFPDVTPLEVRRELDYLEDRKLVALTKSPNGQWSGDLSRYGIDVVEYTVDCDPGIARPVKYW